MTNVSRCCHRIVVFVAFLIALRTAAPTHTIHAQDPPPTGAPTSTPAPTDTATATATWTPLPAPTDTPTDVPTTTNTETPTDVPTETATDTPTGAPSPTETATLAEMTPEATETVAPSTTETETATPTASETETPSITPTPFIGSMILVLNDSFDNRLYNNWQFSSGWLLVSGLQGPGRSLLVTTITEPLSLFSSDAANVSAQITFHLEDGEVGIGIRDNASGRYEATLNRQGAVTLYKSGMVVASSDLNVLPFIRHHLRLTALNDSVTVQLDGLDILSWVDPEPLPAGKILIVNRGPSYAQIDDFSLWIAEMEAPAFAITPLNVPAPPTSAMNTDTMRSQQMLGETAQSHIVFVRDTYDPFTGEFIDSDLYLIDPDGVEPASATAITDTQNIRESYPALSPSGNLIAYTDYSQSPPMIRILSHNGTDGPITPGAGPNWSADGDLIAFIRSSPNGTSQVYMLDLTDPDANLIAITSGAIYVADPPVWSPFPGDRRVVFTAYENGMRNLYLVNFNSITPGIKKKLTNDLALQEVGDWGINGVVYNVYYNGGASEIDRGIYILDPDDAFPTPNLVKSTQETYLTDPVWSPDTERIAYRIVGDPPQIRIFNPMGGGADTLLVTDGYLPSWSLPFVTPLTSPPRSVAPEAQAFHDRAAEFGLPMPFEMFPYANTSLSNLSIPPLGATTFAYNDYVIDPDNNDFQDSQKYDATFGIHPGVDYGGHNSCNYSPTPYTNQPEGKDWCQEQVQAICDGVIIQGRIFRNDSDGGSPGEGGTAAPGWGVALRCFADSALGNPHDTDGDGVANLSNIVVVYNHLLLQPYVNIGDIVSKGDILGITGGDPGYDHLHFEMYFARGFLSIPSPENDYILLNPFLMYSLDLLQRHDMDHHVKPFYPILWQRSESDEQTLTFLDLEQPNVICVPDLNNPLKENRKGCFGIYRGNLDIWSEGGHYPSSGTVQNFWLTQDIGTEGVEWSSRMYPIPDLLSVLEAQYANDPFEYPNCTSTAGVLTCPNDDLQ